MNARHTRIEFWRRPLLVGALAITLLLLLVTAVSANSINDQLMWITVCHTPLGDPDNAQTMVIYWSALDKCLSHFGDYIGACR